MDCTERARYDARQMSLMAASHFEREVAPVLRIVCSDLCISVMSVLDDLTRELKQPV